MITFYINLGWTHATHVMELVCLKSHTWSGNREPQVVHYVIHLGCDTTLFEEHKVCNLTSLYRIHNFNHSHELSYFDEENLVFMLGSIKLVVYLFIYLSITHKGTKYSSQVQQYRHIGAILQWYITTPLCTNSQKTLKTCSHNTS